MPIIFRSCGFILLISLYSLATKADNYLLVKYDLATIRTPEQYRFFDSVHVLEGEKPILSQANPKDSLQIDFSGYPDNLYTLQYTGSTFDKRKKKRIPLVLDRNHRLKAKSHVAHFLLGRRNPDEVMREMQWEDWGTGENHISFVSLWDKDSLYFLVRVLDKNLLHDFQTTAENPFCSSDAIALHFDTEHSHTHLTGPRDIIVYIDVAGNCFVYKGSYGADSLANNKAISAKVALQGTLNNPFDQDIAALYRISIAWNTLQVHPKANLIIGFDLLNYTVSEKDEACHVSAWSGEKTNFRNPSEWGNLVLYRENNLGRIFLMIFVVLVLLVNFFLLIRKKTRYDSEIIDDIHIANSIHEFIIKNLNDTSLSPNSIARYMNLRVNYISNLYQQVKKETIQDAIRQERKQLATTLKNKEHLSETEIMRKTGSKTKEDLNNLLDS